MKYEIAGRAGAGCGGHIGKVRYFRLAGFEWLLDIRNDSGKTIETEEEIMADDFFGELGKSISRATQQAVDKTSVFIERTKITAQISGEQKEIDKLYQVIGEIVYRKVKTGEMNNDIDIAPIIHDIDTHSSQVTTYKRTLADVRNMKICENCGSVIAMDVAFCPKCGAPASIAPRSVSGEKSNRNDGFISQTENEDNTAPREEETEQ